MSREFVWTVWIVVATASFASADSLAVQQILDSVTASSSQVANLYYEADCAGFADLNTDNHIRRYSVRVAFEGAERYAEIAHLRENYALDQDPNWTINVLQEDGLLVLWPLNRIAVVTDRHSFDINPKVGPIIFEVLNKATGWWPITELPPRGYKGFLITESLSNGCTLKEVLLHGCKCIEVSSKLNTSWLDPERNYVVVRRRFQIRDGYYAEFDNERFIELAPKFWMPQTIKTAIVREEGGSKRYFNKEERTITKYEVNVNLDKLFQFALPGGTILRSETGHVIGTETGGLDLLDTMISYAQATLKLQGDKFKESSSGLPNTQTIFTYIAWSIAVFITLLFLVVRKFSWATR